MHSIAIFGGTFDPVHNGHIQTSLSIQSYFHFDAYYFLPCKIPTIKAASLANSQQRIDMLELAIRNFKEFKIDLREINRDSPSYMVESLESLRTEYPNDSITLILGYDAFLSLPKWYQWKKLINLANLLVIDRNEYKEHLISKSLQDILQQHQSNNKMSLLTQKSGVIFLFNAGNYDISSTVIRDKVNTNKQIENKLPKEVYQYIKKNKLYL